MTRRPATNLLILVGASFLVGVCLGAVKGDGNAFRSALGNLSAPWILVAVLPAWRARSRVLGAAVGTVATASALLGFYVSVTFYLHDHLGVEHSGWGSLLYILMANRVWFVAGMVSGPVCGLLAATLGARHPRMRVGYLASGLMMGELVAVRLISGVRLPVLGWSWGASIWVAYELEFLVGFALLGALVVTRARRPSS